MTEFCVGDAVKLKENINTPVGMNESVWKDIINRLKEKSADKHPIVVPGGNNNYLLLQFSDGSKWLYSKILFVKAFDKKEHAEVASVNQREMDFWRLSVREFRTKYNQKV